MSPRRSPSLKSSLGSCKLLSQDTFYVVGCVYFGVLSVTDRIHVFPAGDRTEPGGKCDWPESKMKESKAKAPAERVGST